jgi:hypothetical protein
LPLSSGYEIVAIAPLVGIWRLASMPTVTPFAPLNADLNVMPISPQVYDEEMEMFTFKNRRFI